MNIYLDVGNSRIKWRLDSDADVQTMASVVELAAAWQSSGYHVQALYGCNVRGETTAQKIDLIARRLFEQDVHWLHSTAIAAGVCNGYQDPAALGVDRWVAIAAAHAYYPDRACIVIDAGTAITVDAIEAGGQHRGGVIMPGLRLLFNSLGNAAQLQALSTEQARKCLRSEQALAQNTHEAILSGVILSMRGGVQRAIEQQCEQIKAKIHDIPILVTGGDADMLKIDALQMQCYPDLVLEGVALLAGEMV